MRRATAFAANDLNVHSDFYPRSPCGERPKHKFLRAAPYSISIHALLAESDSIQLIRKPENVLFLSTLSLRRATREPTALRTPHHRFLSTLSLRRATLVQIIMSGYTRDFYPRSPCGERPRLKMLSRQCRSRFLSTLSLRRATLIVVLLCHHISNFYPRSPCGERLFGKNKNTAESQFLSTLSLRRATKRHIRVQIAASISIHALLAESDPMDEPQYQILDISIHALLAESDGTKKFKMPVPAYFYPRSPCGERHVFALLCLR